MNQTVGLPIFLLCLNKGNRHFWFRELQLDPNNAQLHLYRKGKKLLNNLDQSPGLIIIDGYFSHPKPNQLTAESVFQLLMEQAPNVPLFLVSPNPSVLSLSSANRPAIAHSGFMSHEMLQTLHYQIETLQSFAA